MVELVFYLYTTWMYTFDRLAEIFKNFPGIGPRQAKRFVYFLLSQKPEYLEELTRTIGTLKADITQCAECFRFFAKRGSTARCPICADPGRDISELMVVAKDTDLEAMEKSNMYQGKYFVLGGTRALIEKKNTDRLRTEELTARVSKESKVGSLKEVILALSVNPDGEHTSEELQHMLSPFPIKITTLGRGLSTGSELEYADQTTLKNALKNRSSNY